ncbi:hypothetical protein ZWY2020_025539 [Hordeum vulgare]|nr:hypothetical protein ZWY2020_025539 [Hordeum vulgare]
MAGGGGRRYAEAAVRIGSDNVLAALEALKEKKKKPPSVSTSAPCRKVKGTKKVVAPWKGEENAPRQPPEVFWAPTPFKSKSWADAEDEDEDDYFATTAPPRPVWETAFASAAGKAGAEEETESEDDGLDVDMGDDELEESEHGHEVDVPSEPEQLSKKELKKKELAELDAVLADLGISENATLADVTSKSERKPDGQNGVGDKKGLPAPSESKTSKKKKPRKEKLLTHHQFQQKSSKDSKEQPHKVDSSKDHGGAADDTKSGEEATVVDVKEKVKKIAAKHTAMEAAARNAKLTAAKKKEKSHYNQQLVR